MKLNYEFKMLKDTQIINQKKDAHYFLDWTLVGEVSVELQNDFNKDDKNSERGKDTIRK